MKSRPHIIVQLVHIEGPLKGEIQEFSESEISIGRHSSCHLRFPKDATLISRKHARIVREGNRFKLIDHSSNGTFVNGKRVKETYLKDGDVLAIAERGAKVSFLTKIVDSMHDMKGPPPSTGPWKETPMPPDLEEPVLQAHPEISVKEEVLVQNVQVPLIIQFGPTLRSFKELPVTIGKNPSCDFTLDHPNILDRHAQIFFNQDQYWVKDLTGQKLVSIKGVPVRFEAPLSPDSVLSLSPQGPEFRFLGGGRLAEIEKSLSADPFDASIEKDLSHSLKRNKGSSSFKKFFRR